MREESHRDSVVATAWTDSMPRLSKLAVRPYNVLYCPFEMWTRSYLSRGVLCGEKCGEWMTQPEATLPHSRSRGMMQPTSTEVSVFGRAWVRVDRA